ncbi:MAG: helix-turn-helix domain-containing protein, partial [Streptococcaceae bacterium]|nr:helix-turn-helix domain-containing protein [Streptococcaceae bacterium]
MLDCLLEKRYDPLIKLLTWVDLQGREGKISLTLLSSQLKSRPKKEKISLYIEQINKDIQNLCWECHLHLIVRNDVLYWKKGPKFHLQFFQILYLKRSFGYYVLDRIIEESYTTFTDLIREFSYSRRTCYQYLDNVRKLVKKFHLTLDLQTTQNHKRLKGNEKQIRYFIFCFYENVAFLEEFEMNIINTTSIYLNLEKLVTAYPKLLSSNNTVDHISLYLRVVSLRINLSHFVSEEDSEEILDNPHVSYQAFSNYLRDDICQMPQEIREREKRVLYQVFSFFEFYEYQVVKQSKWLDLYLQNDAPKLEVMIVRELEKRLNQSFPTEFSSFLICNMYYINRLVRYIFEVETPTRELVISHCLETDDESKRLAQTIEQSLQKISRQDNCHFLSNPRLIERYVELLKL